MKKIIRWLKEFIREDFAILPYSWFVLFTTAAFIFNYSVDFEDRTLDYYNNSIQGSIYFFLWYSLAWAAILVPKLIQDRHAALRDKKMWTAALLGILILAITSNASLYKLAPTSLSLFERYTLGKIIVYSDDFVFTLIAVFLLSKAMKIESKGFYGFRKGTSSLKPYLTILLLAVPLILWAATQDDFLAQYPNYRPWKFQVDQSTQLYGSALYLVAYASDFVNVEFFFRGFMVIGLSRFLGRHAILPMACMYGFLHFGKPMAEAISSLFGGYLLGVVAWRSESILGGIIVHVGLAFGMELAATVAHFIG